MGITIPRPAMRGREHRVIRDRLRRHAELMAKYEAEGMTRDAASKRAFDEITGRTIAKAEGR